MQSYIRPPRKIKKVASEVPRVVRLTTNNKSYTGRGVIEQPALSKRTNSFISIYKPNDDLDLRNLKTLERAHSCNDINVEDDESEQHFDISGGRIARKSEKSDISEPLINLSPVEAEDEMDILYDLRNSMAEKKPQTSPPQSNVVAVNVVVSLVAKVIRGIIFVMVIVVFLPEVILELENLVMVRPHNIIS